MRGVTLAAFVISTRRIDEIGRDAPNAAFGRRGCREQRSCLRLQHSTGRDEITHLSFIAPR